MGAGDGAALLANQTNAEARRWALSDGQLSAESAERLARLAGLHWLVGSETQLVICEASTGIAAGTMTLRRSGPPDVVGLGYGILPGFRGRGYTTRSLNLLAAWAFGSTPIQRLELGCKVENVASALAAERAGFTREGVFAGRLANPAGGYSDEIRFARVRGGSRSLGQAPGLPGGSLSSEVSGP
jgi:RimJ/RimL family protein N-acetyltransferase